VLELVERILALMGSDLRPDVRNEASNEIRRQYLSAAKARATLNWAPLFGFDDGLRRTIAWYEEFFAATAATGANRGE
jgi:CDP-glucose 4,6-dehydratase